MRRKIGNSFFTFFSAVMTMTVLLAGRANGQTSVFFDDFNYISSTDSNLLNFGWSPRRAVAGLELEPGIPLTSRLFLIPLIQAMN